MSGPQADWHTLPTFRFGHCAALATRLAALVVTRAKTATSSPAGHGASPSVGDCRVCLNGEGTPVAIIETLSLQTLPFAGITAEMAALEGEGDLSLAYWQDARKRAFEADGAWSADMDVIFETFRLVDILDLHFAAEARLHVDAERAAAYAAGFTALGS